MHTWNAKDKHKEHPMIQQKILTSALNKWIIFAEIDIVTSQIEKALSQCLATELIKQQSQPQKTNWCSWGIEFWNPKHPSSALELPNNMLISLGKVEQQQARTSYRLFLPSTRNQFECIKGQIVEMPPVQIWILVFTSTSDDTRTDRWRSHLQQSWRICDGVRPNMEAISKNGRIFWTFYWLTHRCRNQTDGRPSFSANWTRTSTSGRQLQGSIAKSGYNRPIKLKADRQSAPCIDQRYLKVAPVNH